MAKNVSRYHENQTRPLFYTVSCTECGFYIKILNIDSQGLNLANIGPKLTQNISRNLENQTRPIFHTNLRAEYEFHIKNPNSGC